MLYKHNSFSIYFIIGSLGCNPFFFMMLTFKDFLFFN